MMRHTRTLLLGLLLLLVAIEVGCQGPPPSRLAFTDRMAVTNAKIADSSQKIRKALQNARDGKAPEMNTIRSEADKVKKAIADARKEFDNLSLPARPSKSAPALLDAYKDFLKVEEQIYNTQMQKVVQLAQSGGSGNEFLGMVDSEMNQAYMMETPALERVKKAQKDYADEHFLRLQPKR
jgi:hypothetical protein